MVSVAGLHWVDTVSILVLFGFLVYGVVKGFMLQLAGIAVLIGSLLLASFLSDGLGSWLNSEFPTLSPTSAKYICFFVILVVALGIGTALSHLVRKGLERAKVLAYDRLLGGVLGVVKGGLLIIVLLQVGLNLLLPDEGPAPKLARDLLRSRTADVAAWSTDKILVFLPRDMSRKLRRYDKLNASGGGGGQSSGGGIGASSPARR